MSKSSGKVQTPATKRAARKPLAKQEPAKVDKSRTLEVGNSDESKEKQIARLAFDSTVPNSITHMEFSKGLHSDLDLTSCLAVLKEEVQQVNAGNMDKLEGMLVAQAQTLNAIFNTMALRASSNMGQYMQAADTYMRLALKAQSQCRTTIEAIGELKYPKSATFIRQANIANQQQVNNGQGFENSTREGTREEKVISSNELLSEDQHASLDTGRKAAAGRVDSTMATMEAVHRAED